MDNELEKHLEEQQNLLFQKFDKENRVDIDKITKIAGVDLAYWTEQDVEYAVCCIVVIDYKTGEIIEKEHSFGKISVQYIPGLLAFREMPLILETVNKLKNPPDVYIFDGNGYLHKRHMGIATHAGIVLDKPSIGVAKSYYKIGDVDYEAPVDEEGAYKEIVINDEVYGVALRTHKNIKPVFVSVGNMIDLKTSMEVVNSVVGKESHIPYPTRYADIETHTVRKMYQNK